MPWLGPTTLLTPMATRTCACMSRCALWQRDEWSAVNAARYTHLEHYMLAELCHVLAAAATLAMRCSTTRPLDARCSLHGTCIVWLGRAERFVTIADWTHHHRCTLTLSIRKLVLHCRAARFTISKLLAMQESRQCTHVACREQVAALRNSLPRNSDNVTAETVSKSSVNVVEESKNAQQCTKQLACMHCSSRCTERRRPAKSIVCGVCCIC